MSVIQLVQDNVKDTEKKYSEYLTNRNDDVRAGSAFMLYALENIFKNLDFEDIESGIVDSAYRGENHDYGIDAIYLTANGELINSEEEIKDFNRDTKFCFHILQFKKGKGIGQDDLLKLKEGINEVFINSNMELAKNQFMYYRMLFLSALKKNLYKDFASNQITIKVSIVFGGLKSTVESDDLLNKQIIDIKRILSDNAYNFNEVEVVDSNKILELSKQNNDITDVLQLDNNVIEYVAETKLNKRLVGYITLINGSDIARLVKKWQTSLFEANIRDYYRKNDINNKIFETCINPDESKYFWSYNNGLTITCRQVEKMPNKQYRLHGIQIVNGCQTSNALYLAANNIEMFNQLKAKEESIGLTKPEIILKNKIENKFLNEDTTLLVKIIETDNIDLIYKITETTNSQTPIKTFSLKANDNVQQKIEMYLEKSEIYYERRINFYRNQGKKNVVSIQRLFQLQMAQFKFKPSQVRANTKYVFNQNYETIFSGQTQFSLYKVSILVDFAVAKMTREYMKNEQRDRTDVVLLSNGRLHMGVFLLHSIAGKYNKGRIDISSDKIIKALDDTEKLRVHFGKALENFKKIVNKMTNEKNERIQTILTKSELDDKIARFVNSSQVIKN